MSSETLGARPNWHTSIDLHEKPPDIDLNFSLMLMFFLEEQDFYKGSSCFSPPFASARIVILKT